MVEYRVRATKAGDTAEAEAVCNGMAAEGWRLVSTAAANAVAPNVVLYLFFEREVSTMPDEDMARLAAQVALAATR
jgi:hypothetical protein